MKKIAAFLLTLMAVTSLTACAGNKEPAKTNSVDVESSVVNETLVSESGVVTETLASENSVAEGKKVLVAYFSATGTTKGVAEHIANGLSCDFYEIVPEDPYTDADLNYNDNNSRTTIEMSDSSVRPAISGSVENMDQYDVVF